MSKPPRLLINMPTKSRVEVPSKLIHHSKLVSLLKKELMVLPAQPEVEEAEEVAVEVVTKLPNKEEEDKLLEKHSKRPMRTSQPYERFESLILTKE